MKVYQYSWLLPIKNEAESLPQLLGEIKTAMARQTFEVIALDDASSDYSLEVLRESSRLYPWLRVISFPNHQGKWPALRAALDKASGRYIITLDSDLQDDPREAVKLVKKITQGYDLVSGWRKNRQDKIYKVLISRLGNLLVSVFTGQRYRDLNSPFKVYRREILDTLPKEGSLLRFSLLFASRIGYKVAEIPVGHRPRIFGQSKFGVAKYLRIIYDLVLVLLLFTGSGRLSRSKKTA